MTKKVVFIPQEANLTTKQIPFFQIPSYNINILPESKQVASGTLVTFMEYST